MVALMAELKVVEMVELLVASLVERMDLNLAETTVVDWVVLKDGM